MPDEGAWAGKPGNLGKESMQAQAREAGTKTGRQTGRQTDRHRRIRRVGTQVHTCPGRWFRSHTFRNNLLIQTRVLYVECKVASARASASASAVTRCIAPRQCPLLNCPLSPTGSTDHTLFLAPGQGNCHLNYREYPGTVSSLSRGDRGFNGPDFPSPQGPCPQAAAVPGTWSHFPLLCLPVQPRQNRKADHQHVSFSPRSAPSVHSLAHVRYPRIQLPDYIVDHQPDGCSASEKRSTCV